MSRRALPGLLLAAVLAAPAVTGADASELGTARAESRLAGRRVPDIPLTLQDGRRVQLSELWRDRPLLVTFYYRRCPTICMPFLEWVRDAVRDVGGLGSDYHVLALTFDDAETVADLRAQAAALRLQGASGWSFAVADRDAVARVAGALDYWYRLDSATQLYDHNSLLVGIDGGRVVRALLGTPEGSGRFRELVWELRGRFVSVYRVPGRTLLRCLSFDPATGRIRLEWGLLLLLLPGVAAIGLALAVFGGAPRTLRNS
ncbi:MAG: SCO family protein [Gammaproteobacteria bacterium]|nr:SCO family protein [Gammaproteobacteria bacterium]